MEPVAVSSLVQTQSLSRVLAPIAAQVSHLGAITKYPVSARLPGLQQPALNVMGAVQQLALSSQKLSDDTSDEQLQAEMRPAYEQAVENAQALIGAAEVVKDQQPPVNCTCLSQAAEGVFESTLKVLLVWDDSEVRKIKEAGISCLDRLRLVQAAKSMRGLVVCYSGFSEALRQFIPLADKRQKDLTVTDPKRRIIQGLNIIKHSLPRFSVAVQECVKHPAHRRKRESRDDLALKISTAITSIIHAVSKGLEPEDTAASTLRKAKTQLSSDRRYTIGPELSHYIDIILKNSFEVSQTSKLPFKRAILQLCDEVTKLKNDLEVKHAVLRARPTSLSARETFDNTAEQLCDKLHELDKAVADAVLDQVTSVFVETAVPLNQLVDAVTTASQSVLPEMPPATTVLASTGDPQLHTKVELFRRHSQRLGEVAKQAAEGMSDNKRAVEVKDIAKELDTLTHLVVTAALAAKRNNNDQNAQELNMVQRQWREKVQQLTSAIDDMFSPQELMAATEVNIVDDMTKCRDSINQRDWKELAAAVKSIQAKAQRMCDVSMSKAATMTDPIQKNSVKIAVAELNKAVATMTEKANLLIKNPDSSAHLGQFTQSLEKVLNHIHKVQQLIEESEGESSFRPFPAPPTIPMMVDRGTSTPSDPQRFYGTLSPSDDWMMSSSPPSFNPTLSSSQVSDPVRRQEAFNDASFSSLETETQTPRVVTKDKGLQVVLYPGTLGGMSVTNPSMVVGQSWASSKGDLSKTDEHLIGSYAQPLQRVVTAAKEGDVDQLRSHASALSARAIRLSSMAETAASSVNDPDLANVLHKESAKITQLTPQLIRKAQETALQQNPGGEEAGELDIISHQWAGHVRTLIETSQKANLPWSRISGRLVSSARQRRGVEKEVAHITTQTEHMVDIATSTIAAAQVEDAIGSTGNLEHTSDPEVQEQIEQVQNHIEDLQKLTPELISTAEDLAVQTASNNEDNESSENARQYEQLNLLSHEWATKANVLMKDVDEITLGMSGPADSLLIAANSGDPALLEEQARAIRSLASSLQSVAEDAVQGWDDQQQVTEVLETAKLLVTLSEELVTTAQELANITSEERGQENHQLAVEKAEILRRDWASKMQLLTAHIDDLTAEVAAPLDRLVSVALQASRTDGMAKDHLLTQFDKKAVYISEKVEEITSGFSKATANLPIAESGVQMCSRALGFLNKLTPRSIGAARGLSNNPGSAMLDHFSHLRRQWAAKAQCFRAHLISSSATVNVDEVIVSFDELLQGHPSVQSVSSSRYFESPSPSPRPLSRRSYSSEAIVESPGSEQLETSSESRAKFSTTRSPSPSLRVQVTSKRYSQPPSPEPAAARSPHHQPRPITMPNQSTNTELSLNGSSASIFMAAQSLREAADEYYDEGNPVISLAKTMSTQMYHMAEYNRGRGTELQNKSDMITTAKAIAANALEIVKFANRISEQCLDKRVQANLQSCAEMIPTLSTQLRIIASVKNSTPEDASADVMLIKNAQNLMQAVIKTIAAAETAYVKGLKEPESEEESQAMSLAMKWKKKLYRDRTREAFRAPLGARGLRKLNRSRSSTSSLAHLMQQGGTGKYY